MMAVEILHDVETASVDIEMDVALLEIGCVGFPNRHFRVQLFDQTPGGIADALAVNLGVDKQQFQFAALAIYTDDSTSNFLPIEENAVGFLAGQERSHLAQTFVRCAASKASSI